MITKEILAALIQDNKAGGDPPANSKFHTLNIYKWISIAWSTLVDIEYRQTKDINDAFIQPFSNVDVKFDSDRDEFYSDLPARLVAMDEVAGLRTVSPMKDRKTEFLIDRIGSAAMYDGLEAGLSQLTSIYLEGNKIFYDHLDSDNIKKVLIRMVADVDTLAANVPIPIPANKERALVDQVLELLDEPKQTPQDKHNDSNTQQTVG